MDASVKSQRSAVAKKRSRRKEEHNRACERAANAMPGRALLGRNNALGGRTKFQEFVRKNMPRSRDAGRWWRQRIAGSEDRKRNRESDLCLS